MNKLVIISTFIQSMLFIANMLGCSTPIMVHNELSEPVSVMIVPQLKARLNEALKVCIAADPIAPYACKPIKTRLGFPVYAVLLNIGDKRAIIFLKESITAKDELIIAIRKGIPSIGIKRSPSHNHTSLHIALFNNPLKRNEDRWIIDNHNAQYDFFGIFDGHGGSQVAEELKNHIVQFTSERMCLGYPVEKALKDAFEQLETIVCLRQEVHELLGDKRKASVGSCALLVVIDRIKKVVYTANIGDSRALLIQNDTEQPLSSDHKPDRPDESARIKEAGGTVTTKRSRGEGVTKIPARAEGLLAVSRAIGDYHIKRKHPGAIIAQPEITTHSMQPTDKAIVLACDGIWDVLDNKTASTIVRQQMPDPLKAAQELVTQAAQRGSHDDLTAIVIAIAT